MLPEVYKQWRHLSWWLLLGAAIILVVGVIASPYVAPHFFRIWLGVITVCAAIDFIMLRKVRVPCVRCGGSNAKPQQGSILGGKPNRCLDCGYEWFSESLSFGPLDKDSQAFRELVAYMQTNIWDAEADRLGAAAARELLDKGVPEPQVVKFLRLRGISDDGARQLVENAKSQGDQSQSRRDAEKVEEEKNRE